MKKLWIMGLVAGLGLTSLTAKASVLDWNTVAQGTLTKSGFTYSGVWSVGGGEVKVTATPTGPVSFQRFGTAGTQTPAVTDTIFSGGKTSGFSNLSTVGNFTPSSGGTGALTFTIDFLGFKQGVSNVNFTLFDVDSLDHAKFVDRITFLTTAGLSLTGSVDNVVSGNTVSGIKPSNNLGAGSGDGNVDVKYGSLPLSQIKFSFDSPTPNEVLHGFGIGNISFTPVPEVSQLAIGLAACALGAFWLRKAGQRKAVSIA